MPAPSNSGLVNAANPQSAIAVTNANPAAPSSSQFAPLQPTGTQNAQSGQRPASERSKPSRKVEASAVATTSGNGGADSGANNGGSGNSAAPQTFAPQPVQVPAAAPPQAPVCASCGTVASVTPVQQPGQANGVGAVVGGLVGGLLGNQVGGGNGRTAATVIGAIGGGLAGNEVQKRTDAKTVYQVQVRMDDGQVRTTTLGVAPPVGQRVQFGADGGLNPLQ
jgi:outer membrane lipoprotein SlyB